MSKNYPHENTAPSPDDAEFDSRFMETGDQSVDSTELDDRDSGLSVENGFGTLHDFGDMDLF